MKELSTSELAGLKKEIATAAENYRAELEAKRLADIESVRRAIRQRRIESVIIFRRRLVPVVEVERIEAEGRIARVV